MSRARLRLSEKTTSWAEVAQEVCPYDRLCEEACSRCGIDRPIEIGKLQRYAIEQEKLFKMKTLSAPAKKKNAKVACVGAGPASLACAAELGEGRLQSDRIRKRSQGRAAY